MAPKGRVHVGRLAGALADPAADLPEAVRELGGLLLGQIAGLDEKIAGLEREVHAEAKQDEDAVRLMSVPGIGPVCAMAIQAFAPPMEGFERGRDFAAWLGPVRLGCRASTPPAASRGWAGSRRWASAISGGCWWSAPCR